MSTFTHAEIQYLNGQPLGRIATVGPHGRPHVTPVAVFHDPQTDRFDLQSGNVRPQPTGYRCSWLRSG